MASYTCTIVVAIWMRLWLQQAQTDACESCQQHDQPGWAFPDSEQAEGGKGDQEVGWRFDRACPDGRVKSGQQEPHDGGVDAAQYRLERGLAAQGAPEGQRPDQQQKGWQVDTKQRNHGTKPTVGRRPLDGTQVGREGEQRAWDSLGCSIAGQELAG